MWLGRTTHGGYPRAVVGCSPDARGLDPFLQVRCHAGQITLGDIFEAATKLTNLKALIDRRDRFEKDTEVSGGLAAQLKLKGVPVSCAGLGFS